MKTKQMNTWSNEFGKEYTDRNTMSTEELNEMYKKRYGIGVIQLNEMFLKDLDRNIKILEVGSNIGNQLLCLQKMGFKNLYGVELQDYAVEISKQRTKNINIIRGNAFDIPFKDNYFDLVFTAGVLIHIHPDDIEKAIKEIHRCSRQYIFGFEYYADKYTEIPYRGNSNLLWKTNFSKLYTDKFPDLNVVKEKLFKYIDEPSNQDVMFLLEKNQ